MRRSGAPGVAARLLNAAGISEQKTMAIFEPTKGRLVLAAEID
jgi:hypothetical protein